MTIPNTLSPMQTIDKRDIGRNGPGNILAVCWRWWRTERRLARRGIRFRSTDVNAVVAAYAAMSEKEFEAINGLQAWANWRTIPRALSGHVPDRPLRVLDLGCGSGDSTRVLAFYCPAGSRITGYEFAQPLVEFARGRNYRHRSGGPADVTFCCQGVTEPLREPDGQAIADQSVDLVNASGVVGHHLSRETVAPLVAELKRVLVPDGTAMLDVGPTLRARELREVMEANGFRALGRRRSWLLDPTGEVIFRLGR
jgi:SAM-dependent methyltransferase